MVKEEQTVEQTAVPEQKKRKPKHWKRWLILGGVAVIGVAFVAKRFTSAGPGAVELSYTEAQVERRTITKSLTGSGTLQPADSYTVTTLIEGEVLSAGFEEGDVVEKDTVLYQIDSSDAANNIEKAQISLEQAQRNYNSTLKKQTVQTKTTGTVYSLAVEVGDEVDQGQSLATIRDDSVMLLEVPFPADDAAGFSVGQTALVTLDGSFETLTGTVHAIAGGNDVGSGNIITRTVTIAVENPGGLASGQVATAAIDGLSCAGSGSFTYRAEGTVTASASGTVTAIHTREGDWVTKDETLFTLGGDTLTEQLQSASDSLRNAQLSMDNTQEQLENYTITSPISGTVIDKYYKAGDTVESGRTLCTIYDLSYLEMTLSIDELDIGLVAVGQKVAITADAVEGASFEGVITKVSVAGNTSGGITSYPVTVRIDETGDLLPGMNVDAEIVIQEAQDTLAISSSAVSRGSNGATVVLLTQDSPSAANALDREAPEGYAYVEVETGISDDSYVEILSGLQEGDTVAYLGRSSSGSDAMMMGGMPGGMGGGGMAGGMSGGGMPGGGNSSGGRPGGGGGFPG